nr:hypothetical protein [Tanacetum cinerariifolium]
NLAYYGPRLTQPTWKCECHRLVSRSKVESVCMMILNKISGLCWLDNVLSVALNILKIIRNLETPMSYITDFVVELHDSAILIVVKNLLKMVPNSVGGGIGGQNHINKFRRDCDIHTYSHMTTSESVLANSGVILLEEVASRCLSTPWVLQKRLSNLLQEL